MHACRLHELDAGSAAERLPAGVHVLLPLLAADSEAVRFAAGTALAGLIARCLDDDTVMRAVSLAGAPLCHASPVLHAWPRATYCHLTHDPSRNHVDCLPSRGPLLRRCLTA
jgi:hypothetical protein